MDERSECEKPSLSGPEFLPHFAEGNIVKGFGRGSRELGFPTANFSEEVIDNLPKELIGGIYWGFASVDKGTVHGMVMSIGWNPFYNNEKRAMETHILHNFDGELYGQWLKVIMVGYLRPELNYTTLENLKTAIQGDIDNAKLEMEKPEFISFKTHPFFSS
ncbi:riboflavin kinase [Eurytemora carolleeae]|uniref:riboflavin kinase n=1 Tax=Eurytemora carolleeae TaxID=1294199 RepID=UPI000C771BB5|nr:riboflavin kinase [Eurytemora carolleeae]|eukprot:XP_023340298.1 riboflavin kinase-like [Eurytemora affinis]